MKPISPKLPTQKINEKLFKSSLDHSWETVDFNVLNSTFNSECFGKRIEITATTLMVTDSMEWEHRTSNACYKFVCLHFNVGIPINVFFPRSSFQWPWLPPANEVWVTVIFSPACVILFTGWGSASRGVGQTPPPNGTHPTGMHCYRLSTGGGCLADRPQQTHPSSLADTPRQTYVHTNERVVWTDWIWSIWFVYMCLAIRT